MQQLDHGNAEQRIVIVGSQAETAFDVSEGALEITQGIACPGPVRQCVSLQPDIRIEGYRTVEALDRLRKTIAVLGREPPAEMSLRHGRADRDRGVIGCRGLFQPSQQPQRIAAIDVDLHEVLSRGDRPVVPGDGVFVPTERGKNVTGIGMRLRKVGLERDGTVIARQCPVTTSHRLQRGGVLEPGLERGRLGGNQAVIDRDDVLRPSQHAKNVRQPDIGIDEITLAGNGPVEALDRLIRIAGIAHRGGEQVVGGRMTGSGLDGLAQHVDGIVPLPKLAIGHAEEAERIHVSRMLTKDAGIACHRISNRTLAVPEHRLLEQKIDRRLCHRVGARP